MFGAKLLEEFGIDFRQMHEGGGVTNREPILIHFGAFFEVVVKLQLGNAASDRKEFDAPAQLLAALRQIQCRWRTDQRCATCDAFDRHHPAVATGPHEGVGFLRGKAGIQGKTRQRQRSPRGMGPGFGDHPGQGFPDRITGGITHQHPMLDQPGFLAAPEGPDRGLDAILLYIGPADQEQATVRHTADPVVLTPLDEALPVGGFTFLDPGFAQFRVLESLDGRCRTGFLAHRRLPGSGNVLPTAPADRAVER